MLAMLICLTRIRYLLSKKNLYLLIKLYSLIKHELFHLIGNVTVMYNIYIIFIAE